MLFSSLFIGLIVLFQQQSILSYWKHPSYVNANNQHQKSISTTKLSAEIRVLIQGTKNAYTTAGTHDVLSYRLLKPLLDHTHRLGVLSADGKLLPLCVKSEGSAEFHIDPTEAGLSAEKLKAENRLGRVYSADRLGMVYTIDEYIDENEIYIPIVDLDFIAQHGVEEEAKTGQSASDTTVTSQDSLEVLITQQEMEIAKLKLKVLQLQQLQQQKQSTQSSQQQHVSIRSEAAPVPIGPYAQAVRHSDSHTVYVSGCIGIDPSLGKLVSGGIEAEMAQALSNLQATLQASESSSQQMMKVTIYCTDLAQQYPVINRMYGEFLAKNTVMPARTTVQVSALPLGAMVEIDAIAFVKNE